ncbi:threonine/serine exporter family protein [Salinibacterium sp. dk2585]|uniref:threonine/serine ThrE exporter family protein n=1 Tax=unclassified Salinibacterium TaxID=2632331 RepID=UPI0011C2461A|nr:MULTISPECIES: threonine/serine exporter family protein [unclassified Salinibacterium]QEE62446.1 threonine/serine exporter family protein [Salinibacterium sp. dk2585]TXK52671.1 threonine/serine exporter family protein [Salinibacterium sp. dk5596]
MTHGDHPEGPQPPARSLLHRVTDLVRGSGAPTQIISIIHPSTGVPERQERAVIDFCLRAGEAMLAIGASAADVVAMLLRISESYGINGMHVDIAFTSITVSVHRGMDDEPTSVMRVVRVRTTDYTRLQKVYRLIFEITETDQPLDVEVARARLVAILHAPHPYRRWVMTAGQAILAGGVVVMFNVSFVLILVAAASAVISSWLARRLSKWAVPAFFSQMAVAAFTTWIAVLFFWLREMGFELPGANHPTVIVISGIIMLLSGIGLTSAARDAIDGYYVTASARGLEVVMLTLGLAVGISLTLGLALRMGVPVSVATSLGPEIEPVPGIIGASLIGVGFALTSYVRLLYVPLMAAAAGIVFAVYAVLAPSIPQPGIAPAFAGVVAGIIGYLLYRWVKIPESAITMAGIIGLIPGLALYRALYSFMETEFGVTASLPELVIALSTGVGLAAGTTIGGFMTRSAFGLDRAARLALRRSRVVR